MLKMFNMVPRCNEKCATLVDIYTNKRVSIVSVFFSHCPSLADRDPFLDGAVLTLNHAAPVEFAEAALGPAQPHDVVAAAAAEGGAAVAARARAVALAARGPGYVHEGVALAEVGRLLVVEELLGEVAGLALALAAVLALAGALGASPASAPAAVLGRDAAEVALRDEDRVPEAVLEALADYPQVRGDLPAGLEAARAGHAVALAAFLHVAGDGLEWLVVW